MIYPDVLSSIIEYLKKLPGIGEKTAERMALSLLDLTEEETKQFSKLISEIKIKLKTCEICGHLTDKNVCDICDNADRNQRVICVVEDYKSVFVFEKIGNYNGVYHVLNGLISPMNKVYPDDIDIHTLVKRCNNLNNDVELIMALKPTIEGEATALYIKKIFEEKDVSVSRLSYGIPMGAEIDYLDTITLERALNDRKEM